MKRVFNVDFEFPRNVSYQVEAYSESMAVAMAYDMAKNRYPNLDWAKDKCLFKVDGVSLKFKS